MAEKWNETHTYTHTHTCIKFELICEMHEWVTTPLSKPDLYALSEWFFFSRLYKIAFRIKFVPWQFSVFTMYLYWQRRRENGNDDNYFYIHGKRRPLKMSAHTGAQYQSYSLPLYDWIEQKKVEWFLAPSWMTIHLIRY